MKILTNVITCVAMLLVSGCTVTREPQLYPSNSGAQKLGPLMAHLEGHGGGNGKITVALPSGEVLSGRYFINVGGAMSFGTANGIAFGPGGVASFSGTSSGFSVANSGNGSADMIGPSGTSAHCEFMNNNMVGHGAGFCHFSNGADYRMQY